MALAKILRKSSGYLNKRDEAALESDNGLLERQHNRFAVGLQDDVAAPLTL